MTREEALMLSAYTGVLLVPDFEDVHRYCEELMGFPILTHEFAEERLRIEIREKLRPRVWALCQAAADNPSGSRGQAAKAAGADRPGSWVEDEYGYSHCPSCGYEFDDPEHVEDFCPSCGEPKTDEAVQMVMERLEGMKDG